VFGYICGAFPGYTFALLWKETPHTIGVLHEQARRERERREIEAAHAALYAASKPGIKRLNELEGRGI
jgi:hypothetical protein